MGKPEGWALDVDDIGATSVYRCPVRPQNPNVLYPDFVMNTDVFPYYSTTNPDPNAVMTLTRLKKPTRTLLLADALTGGSSIGLMFQTDPADSCAIDYRHNNGTNILFGDYHVSWMKSPGPGNTLDIAHTSNILWE